MTSSDRFRGGIVIPAGRGATPAQRDAARDKDAAYLDEAARVQAQQRAAVRARLANQKPRGEGP